MKINLLVMLLIAWSHQVLSDDIDLYVKNTTDTTKRPSVLIILDNSGSMLWDINDNRLNNNGTVNDTRTKAYLARQIIVDLINENPDVDFALQLFNRNADAVAAVAAWTERRCNQWNCWDVDHDAIEAVPAIHGGRIVYGLNDLSNPTNKADLMGILYSNEATGTFRPFEGGYTPLCETLFETYQYLSGGEVYYGNDSPTTTPLSIRTEGSYTSPFDNIVCDKEITIIYITDGAASRDEDAANVVPDLTDDTSTFNDNYLGNLGSWMGTTNFNSDEPKPISETTVSEIVGSVKLHTVGFGAVSANNNAVDLLKLASRDGIGPQENIGFRDTPSGGQYHQASDAAALKAALEQVLYDLTSKTLTSASVSANSFDRTQTLDSVYYSLFEPSNGARWQGNLKKYKIVNGKQEDALGNAAVDSSTGEFSITSKSFWSTEVDGNDVKEGGVAEMLRTKATASRTFFTDVTGPLETFTIAADITGRYADDDELIAAFDVPIGEVSEIPNHIKWAMGVDVDNESSTNIREDVFGDPLHSMPVVVNYGTGNPRIVVGTNAGVLHMFEDKGDTNEVVESWAYLPEAFFKNIKPLRENNLSVNNKIYGLDGEITLHIIDEKNDGKVDGGDKAFLFFGLRRGGSSYYALDITNKDEPKLMWHIENTDEFKDLGLTFSKPKVVRSALNTDDPDQLVVIFGGGYDTKKDEDGPNTHDDTLGTSIYMVNARTGNKIFIQPTGNKNSIASSIATLDSDSDGLVDRFYVGDTGGSVWRLDMPDETTANNSIIEFASLGGITNADDRRFFNEPTIVRTYILETYITGSAASPNIIKQEVPYDAILLGSGDKATPLNSQTEDKFFMLKDKYIRTQKFGSSPATSIPDKITYGALYDYTDDPFKNYPDLSPTQKANLAIATSKSGWHFDLALPGEKNSAKSIVLNSVVYFTSYAPESETTCSVEPGNSWLYAVDLAFGFKKYNWSEDDNNREDRIKKIDNQFLGTPTFISTPVLDEDGEEQIEGKLIVGKEIFDPQFSLQTMRTSVTIPEN